MKGMTAKTVAASVCHPVRTMTSVNMTRPKRIMLLDRSRNGCIHQIGPECKEWVEALRIDKGEDAYETLLIQK